MTGFLCLAFAENLPIDSAINPLVPVLAHTSWLAIHVMTIMLSYSALAVAMVIGHAGLFFAAFQRRKVDLASALSKALYRTLQIGVLFLAAGPVFSITGGYPSRQWLPCPTGCDTTLSAECRQPCHGGPVDWHPRLVFRRNGGRTVRERAGRKNVCSGLMSDTAYLELI